MSSVVIIKYNAGNVQSVMYALDRIGASYELSDDPETIQRAERIIFPGVGEASTAMQSLLATGLAELIPTLKQPFLGTCVGMQLLCASSEEGPTDCLGIFDVPVLRFPATLGFKIPQTGWNNLHDIRTPLCEGLPSEPYVYYNHGFYVPLCDYTVAQTTYMIPYSAMLQKDNFIACQFHSEISGQVGQQIFENFLRFV